MKRACPSCSTDSRRSKGQACQGVVNHVGVRYAPRRAVIGFVGAAVRTSEMTKLINVRLALTAPPAILAFSLAACQEPVAPPPPPVAVAPPPPPPITLSSEVTELAAAYEGYMERAGAVSPA